MGKKYKSFRECEECGAPIESSNPAVRLCKRCESELQGSRANGKNKRWPKEYRKRKKRSIYEEYFDDFDDG